MEDAIVAHLEAEKAGSIFVRNAGGYVARFIVRYKLKGKIFEKESGKFTAGVNKSIEIPAGATEIFLEVKAAVFIRTWSTIFTQSFPDPVTKCYKVWGTTLITKWEEISCS